MSLTNTIVSIFVPASWQRAAAKLIQCWRTSGFKPNNANCHSPDWLKSLKASSNGAVRLKALTISVSASFFFGCIIGCSSDLRAGTAANNNAALLAFKPPCCQSCRQRLSAASLFTGSLYCLVVLLSVPLVSIFTLQPPLAPPLPANCITHPHR